LNSLPFCCLEEFHNVSVCKGIEIQAGIHVLHGSGSSHYYRHVFGQPAKKEHGFENVKITNSAWDTNIVSASGVSSFGSYLELLSFSDRQA